MKKAASDGRSLISGDERLLPPRRHQGNAFPAAS
jgi:hypothetical protein